VNLSFVSLHGVTNGTTTRLDCRATIELRQDLSPAYMAVVAAHELGHALGLDHDSDERSLMYKSAPYDGGTIPRADLEYVESLLEPAHDAGF
jgi:predicted Zn-dependent protease